MHSIGIHRIYEFVPVNLLDFFVEFKSMKCLCALCSKESIVYMPIAISFHIYVDTVRWRLFV